MGFQMVAGKGWRYRFEHLKRNYTGQWFKTKAASRAAREEHRKRLAAAAPEATPTAMAFSDLANEYLDYARRKFARKTYQYKAYVLRQFMEFTGDRAADAITPLVVEGYLRTRPGNTNYNRHRKDLGALFAWGQRRGLVEGNPCLATDPLPETPRPRPVPTPGEMARILAAAGEYRPLLLVLYHTMARIGEVLRLRWADINLTHRELALWTRKRRGGALERDYLPMNEPLCRVLAGLWRGRAGAESEFVFVNPRTGTAFVTRPKIMRTICARAGVPLYGFHAIRHFVADQLHDTHKVPLKRVSQLLRHKSLRTTEIYLARVPADLRDTMEILRNPHMEAAHGEEEKPG